MLSSFIQFDGNLQFERLIHFQPMMDSKSIELNHIDPLSKFYVFEAVTRTGEIDKFVIWNRTVVKYSRGKVQHIFMRKHESIKMRDNKSLNLGNSEIRMVDDQLTISRTGKKNYYQG